MHKVHIKTTPWQRRAISLVRNRLGENGHFIYPVARWYRRHSLDFVAFPKGDPQSFVVVRPMRRGRISVRPYGMKINYVEVDRLLGEISSRVGIPLAVDHRQLPKREESAWRRYLPSEQVAACEMLRSPTDQVRL